MRLHPSVWCAIALVATACSTGGGTGTTTASTTGPGDDSVEAEPAASTTVADPAATDSTQPSAPAGPALDWVPCADLAGELDCATLAVPLDHADPAGPQIDLALVRRPADGSSARIGSLVVNPGGPGGSGLEYLELAVFGFSPAVAEVFDIVSFDPRGVGSSASISCEIDRDDGVELVDDDDRAAWDALVAESLGEIESCTADPANLAEFVGTNNAARDLDLIRAAVGDDRLTYVGFSYGTRLGAVYAELFPDRVRALVLDGGVAPTDDLTELGAGQAGGFDLAFDRFATACDSDRDCPLQDFGPTADVLAGLRAEIAETGSFETDDPDRVLTPGELDLGVAAALYSRDAWQILAEGLVLAEASADGTILQVLGDSLTGRQTDGTYNNLIEAGGFINCADDPERPEPDDVFAAIDRIADTSEQFSSFLRASTGCIGIPAAVDPLRLGPATGAAPILVIGTTGDPATPYEWSVELADFLASAVLFTVEGEGHTAYNSIACVGPTVDAYLIDLEVPPDGSTCADGAAADVFLPAGESELDRVVDFFACLRDEGLDIDEVTIADVLADPTGEELFAGLDPTDPAFQQAAIACQSILLGP